MGAAGNKQPKKPKNKKMASYEAEEATHEIALKKNPKKK